MTPPARRSRRELLDAVVELRRDLRDRLTRAEIDTSFDHPIRDRLRRQVLVLRAVETLLHAWVHGALDGAPDMPAPPDLVLRETDEPIDPATFGDRAAVEPRSTPWYRQGQYA